MADDKVDHQFIADRDEKQFGGSGRDTTQVHAPVVSVNPTSQQQGLPTTNLNKSATYKTISSPNLGLSQKPNFTEPSYPFLDLKPGQGMFLPVEENSTTDALMEKVNKAVAIARTRYSEIERNEKGDEIWDQVIIKTRKRNADGTLQLDGEKRVIEGANDTIMPRYANVAHFMVKAVVKDDDLGGEKASSDGVLVIRA